MPVGFLWPRNAAIIAAAVLLAACLAGCATGASEIEKPVPHEEPINSLALEQCVRENGLQACRDQIM